MTERSEKAKMLAGELYLAADPELHAERQHARRLLRWYNATYEDDLERRVGIIQGLFGAAGEHVLIEPPFFCDYGSHIFAGDYLYMNYGCIILDCAEVHLGTQVSCGPYVQILAADHPTDPALRATGKESASPVHIGNNVWIGAGAIICPGVTIGDNTTIGAGSVVVKDIPANVLAVGNPCRVVRSC